MPPYKTLNSMENKEYISDELLAAYLDGNTTREETEQVLRALQSDPSLQEVLQVAIDVDSEPAQGEAKVLPMLEMAAESSENLCGILCELYVLQRRFIRFEKEQLIALAKEQGWLRPAGVPLHAMGQLLSHMGLIVTRKYDGSLDDIYEALAHDNDVIVAVDSDKLYAGLPDEEDAVNHAVVVSEIDQKADTVTIYDPQHRLRKTVDCCDFELAWRESQYYMVRVLQSVDEYTPKPIYLKYIPLDDDLKDLQEAIAENAHNVWAEARMKEGWHYGKERNDAEKLHPDLVPYTALPDSEKEYDRIMAFNTIKLVKKLGYDIVRRNNRGK